MTDWLEERFGDPDIPNGEATTYRGKIGGDVAGSGTSRIEAHEDLYAHSIEIDVREDANLSVEILFKRRSGEVLASTYRAITSYKDKQVSVEDGRFEGVKGLHWGGDLTSFPRSMTPLLGCALALRGLEFRRGQKRSLAVWLANTVWWEVHLHVEKAESVELPFGEVRAWRVRARPHFGQIAGPLERLIRLLMPPFILHFAEQPPHRVLRFEFPTGPFPWNPRGLIEATDLN